MKVSLNYKNVLNFVSEEEIKSIKRSADNYVALSKKYK